MWVKHSLFTKRHLNEIISLLIIRLEIKLQLNISKVSLVENFRSIKLCKRIPQIIWVYIIWQVYSEQIFQNFKNFIGKIFNLKAKVHLKDKGSFKFYYRENVEITLPCMSSLLNYRSVKVFYCNLKNLE